MEKELSWKKELELAMSYALSGPFDTDKSYMERCIKKAMEKAKKESVDISKEVENIRKVWKSHKKPYWQTPEWKPEKIKMLKEEFKMKRFKLKKWAPPGDNPNWSHDHCEICNKDLGKGDIAYSDDKNFYWVCKECFKKYKRN